MNFQTVQGFCIPMLLIQCCLAYFYLICFTRWEVEACLSKIPRQFQEVLTAASSSGWLTIALYAFQIFRVLRRVCHHQRFILSTYFKPTSSDAYQPGGAPPPSTPNSGLVSQSVGSIDVNVYI